MACTIWEGRGLVACTMVGEGLVAGIICQVGGGS